jgi:hypothetical protein
MRLGHYMVTFWLNPLGLQQLIAAAVAGILVNDAQLNYVIDSIYQY